MKAVEHSLLESQLMVSSQWTGKNQVVAALVVVKVAVLVMVQVMEKT